MLPAMGGFGESAPHADVGPARHDRGLRFALVPWTPARERRRDREVSGVAKENGGIEWDFARKRELEI
jgi:hypothetical protein